MTETLRLVVLLVLAGIAITIAAAGFAWWGDAEKRLARLIRKVLGGRADAQIISAGRNAAIGVSFAAEQAVVLWDGGASALLYPLDALEGGELLIDDVVAARAWRGEPRRALDAIAKDARQVTLRLVFDNPRDPEFILDLWLPEDARRRGDRGPAAAITEARTWLARIEALLRRPRAALAPDVEIARPAAPPVAPPAARAAPPAPEPELPLAPPHDPDFDDEDNTPELPF